MKLEIKQKANTNEVGRNIKRYRLEANLSQEAFAEKVYSTKSTISKWENGDIVPSIDMIKIIAKSLGVSLYSILGEKQPLSNKVFNFFGRAIFWGFIWMHIDLTIALSIAVTSLAFFISALFVGVGGFGADLTYMIMKNDFGSMRVAILIGWLIWAPLFFVLFGSLALGLYIIARQLTTFSQRFFWKNKKIKWEMNELSFIKKIFKNKKMLYSIIVVCSIGFIYLVVIVSIEGTSPSHWSNFNMNF